MYTCLVLFPKNATTRELIKTAIALNYSFSKEGIKIELNYVEPKYKDATNTLNRGQKGSIYSLLS